MKYNEKDRRRFCDFKCWFYYNTHVKNSISYNTKESCLIGAVSLRLRGNLKTNGKKRCCILLDTLVSGSPLIQNGKLIGAVTHVLVDDPTKGYAIFAENMLETAQSVAEEQLKEAS